MQASKYVEEIVLKAGLLIKDVHSELIFREAYE